MVLFLMIKTNLLLSYSLTRVLSRLHVKQKIVQFPLVSMLRMSVQYLDKVGSDYAFHL